MRRLALRTQIVAAVGVLAVLVIAGCAMFTKTNTDISMPVQQAKDIMSKVEVIHDRIAPILNALCQKDALSASACMTLTQSETEYRQMQFQFDVALQNPGTSIDWAKVQQALDNIGKLAALLPKP